MVPTVRLPLGMTARERLKLLKATHESPLKIALPRDVVWQLDQFLGTYGIKEPLSLSGLEGRAEACLTVKEFRKFQRVSEARNDAYNTGHGIAEADRAFYDAVSSEPLLGIAHSARRAFILDSLAALHWVCDTLAISGPVLDVGCHAGYHLTWIAQRFGLPVIGLDRSFKAVEYATRRSLCGPWTFISADVCGWTTRQSCDVIFLNDGPFSLHRPDRDLARLIAENLNPGGVVISIGDIVSPQTIDGIKKTARSYGLSFGLADAAGGWLGHGYETCPVLILVKGHASEVSDEFLLDYSRVWEASMAQYALAPATPLRERTQAFYRADVREQRNKTVRSA